MIIYGNCLVLFYESRYNKKFNLRDVGQFMEFIGEEGAISKKAVIAYKQKLAKNYAVTSANSMLAAVNGI